MAGNLSSHSIDWCVDELLSEENKQRISIMINKSDFYRLDNAIEVDAHPLPSHPTITSPKVSSRKGKLIKEAEYVYDNAQDVSVCVRDTAQKQKKGKRHLNCSNVPLR